MTPTDGPDTTSDPTEPTDTAHSSRPDRAAPPGSVAEEAALLLDLLSRRGRSDSSGMPSRAPEDDRADGARSDDHDHPAGSEDSPPPPPPPRSEGSPREGGRRDGAAGECTCGGSTPAACRVCPVCQLIAFVQQVNPDTIDRVADFIGFAATALRDLATTQRERRSEPGTDSTQDAADTTADTTADTDRTRPGDSV